MQTIAIGGRVSTTRRELLGLLAASFACVMVLALVMADASELPALRLSLRQGVVLVLIGTIVVAALAAIVSTVRAARIAVARSGQELAQLRRNLLAAEAVISAEPQVLVFWDHCEQVRVVTHSLSHVAGLPPSSPDLLRFGEWLDATSSADLKAALDRMFEQGRPFSLLIKTRAGGNLEADGRTSGGRAILRLRDVTGYKQDLMRIVEQHRTLGRDIRADRTLLQALPVPVWFRDRSGRLTWVNTAYAKAVDAADAEEVVRRQVELLERRQRAAAERMTDAGREYRKRLHLVIEGERKPHDIVVLPSDDVVVGAALDAGAAESAQGRLDREMAAFDRTLDRVTTAVAIFGPDKRLQFYNEAYAQLWQLDRAWLQSKPTDGELLDRLRSLSRLPAMVDYRAFKAKWQSIMRTGSEVGELWHLPDGRMVEASGQQRPDGGLTCLYDDVTERLQLESKFSTLIDVQRETLDSLKEGVAVFGTDGRMKLFNAPFAAMWKLSARRLEENPHIDRVIEQASTSHEENTAWTDLARCITSMPEGREPLSGQMVRADGTVLDFTGAPLPDGGTLVTFADVTAARRYERALIERNEALVAADRLKNQFISHISYELRTPLTNIIGFGELMEQPRTGPLNSRQRDYLSDIKVSSQALLAIIDDILDLASIDAGALELKLAPAGVGAIVDQAVLGVRDRAERAGQRIEVSIEPEVQEFIADGARVRQVLYKLLSNAIGFSPAGASVKVRCTREQGMISFSVSDDGVGIPKDQLSQVFDRFEARSQGSGHRGAGLGLSIVKSLVELHGGDMQLVSEPGRGTRVTVRFPERGDGSGQPSSPASEAGGTEREPADAAVVARR